MIEFYGYNEGEYEQVGSLDNGDVDGDVDWIADWIESVDIEITDEEEILERVSNQYLVGVIPEQEVEQRGLSEGTPEWDAHFLNLHQRIWAEDSDKQLVQFNNSETPEFVKQRLKDAIWSGSVFSEFDTIPSSELTQLREFLTEQLEDDNWSIDGIANRLQDLDADLSADEAEVIARTETASTVNTAREIGYEERGEEDDVFKWVGVFDDGRTTEACQWLLEQTNPKHGGDPVSLERLKELVEEAPSHDPDMDDNLARPDNYVVHPNERKTFVRHVE